MKYIKKIRFNSIKSRLIYWFLLMGLAPLLALMIAAYIQRVNAVTISSEEKIAAIRDLKVAKLNQWVDENIGDLNVMSGDYQIRSLEAVFNNHGKRTIEDNNKLKVANELLYRNLINHKRFSNIFIINSNTGLIELSTNENSIGCDEVSSDYYKKVLESKNLYIEEVHFTEYTNKPHLTFSNPILCLAHSKHIIGVFVVEIDLDKSINELMFNRVGLGETGETILINKDTVALNELRWYKNAALKLKIKAKPAKRAAKGETGVIVSNDYRGKEVLEAYTYLPKLGWGFVSKQDMSEINAPILKMVHQFIILFFASAFVIFIMAVTISKSILKPIIILERTAKKIGKGDFSIVTGVNSADELGSLSKSVNKMILSLKSKELIQKGVKDISSKIMEQTSLQQFSTDIITELKAITKAKTVVFYVLNELSSKYEPFVSLGIQNELLQSISTLEATTKFGKNMNTGDVFYQTDYPENEMFNLKKLADFKIPKQLIAIPVKVEEIVVAFIVLLNDKPFTIESYQIIKQSTLNIDTSYSSLISNLRVGILAENILKVNEALDDKSKILGKKNIALLKQTSLTSEANKELESFAYSVSHDLRAPLRHIDGFTKLLNSKIKDNIDEKAQGYFDNIISSSKQMNQLIDDLLTFSRMNRKELNRKNIKMNIVVNGALKTFDLDIKNNKVEIVIDKLSKAKIDTALISYVWINLMSNAIKFTRKTKNPKIHIGIDEETEKQIVYFIKDNGVGFNQKYVDKIFGVFQRLHTSNEFPGTGIGLANVKRIINKHNGSIRAEGKINKGATFFITLPKT
ncbi:MAG: ATP-binding protein [Flavobacteriaceae bacterium]